MGVFYPVYSDSGSAVDPDPGTRTLAKINKNNLIFYSLSTSFCTYTSGMFHDLLPIVQKVYFSCIDSTICDPDIY
jgi:hypothetical protein